MEDEFDAFVRARSRALLRTAYLLTADQHLAEDLVQSALARTHRAWANLHEAGNAEAYTRKIMYHLQVSWWRKRRVAETLPGEVPDRAAPGAGDLAELSTLRLALRQALSGLSPKQRAVIVLRFFDDCSEGQAADILSVTVDTFRLHTSR